MIPLASIVFWPRAVMRTKWTIDEFEALARRRLWINSLYALGVLVVSPLILPFFALRLTQAASERLAEGLEWIASRVPGMRRLALHIDALDDKWGADCSTLHRKYRRESILTQKEGTRP